MCVTAKDWRFTYIDNLANKILHTFEKMDAINPTRRAADRRLSH